MIDPGGRVEQWVPLGTVAVDGGLLALAPVPVDGALNEAAAAADVELGVDLRVSHQIAAVVVRAGAGDGIYPVLGRLAHAPDGTAHLAEIRVVFLRDGSAG